MELPSRPLKSNPGLSAVLPLKAQSGKTNSFEQCELLFESLLKFGKDLYFDQFFIVCPRKAISVLEEKLSRYSPQLPLKFMPEELLIGRVTRMPWISGWRRQQLIKLAIATHINSGFYLTFDSDVLLKRPIRNQDLIFEGKALLQTQHKSVHANWWKGSGEILRLDPDLSGFGMSVTPAILHSESVRAMQVHISKMYKKDWMDQLLKSYKPFPANLFVRSVPWSEYSLYYLYLCESGLLESVHLVTKDPRLISKSSVWSDVDFAEWDASYALNESEGFFLVIQSNKGLPFEEIRSKVLPHLSIREKDNFQPE